MAATMTLAIAQAQLTLWIAASTALAGGRSFSMNGRTLTREDATQVREMITYWSGIEAQLLHRAQLDGTTDRGRAAFGVARF